MKPKIDEISYYSQKLSKNVQLLKKKLRKDNIVMLFCIGVGLL